MLVPAGLEVLSVPSPVLGCLIAACETPESLPHRAMGAPESGAVTHSVWWVSNPPDCCVACASGLLRLPRSSNVVQIVCSRTSRFRILMTYALSMVLHHRGGRYPRRNQQLSCCIFLPLLLIHQSNIQNPSHFN